MADNSKITIDEIAIQKAGNIPGWRPYYYKRLDSGVIVRGCLTDTFKRGPRKGQTKYLTKEMNKVVVLSEDELRQCGN